MKDLLETFINCSKVHFPSLGLNQERLLKVKLKMSHAGS